MSNYLSKLFGTSPVAPLQKHMEACCVATQELIPFFKQTYAGNWEKVSDLRERIVEAEQKADALKREIRLNLPKKMFMPVPRSDLLDLLLVQDLMANKAREISGFVVGRQIEIPEAIQDDFIAYVERNNDAATKALASVNELDELYETGFRGTEVDIVQKLLAELDNIENDTDTMQTRIRYQLFQIEQDLPPVNVMFLYRIIELVGEIGDLAERIGHRLELLLSH
ncbi:MAG: putative phosphate transport protein (TIGR00153 family) [Gammaproteobacteria bacterium]|jgi:predicted phosphate transport protein (TIGR00153 family)